MDLPAASILPASAGPAATRADPAAMRADRAAKEFEALLIAQMLAPMFEKTKTPALFGGGKGEQAFTSLLHEEFAKAISMRGGFGVADVVKAEMIRIQAAQLPQR